MPGGDSRDEASTLCQSGPNTGPWQQPDPSLISRPGNRFLQGMLKTPHKNWEHVTEMVRQDPHSLWLAPAGIPGPPRKESFQTTALQQRKLAVQVPVAGGTRMTPPEPGMPFQAEGRVLSAVMRNGSRLCPRSLLHQCAAVLRSGRVCGDIPGPNAGTVAVSRQQMQTSWDCGRSRRPRPGRFDWWRPGKWYASSRAPLPLQAARISGLSVQAPSLDSCWLRRPRQRQPRRRSSSTTAGGAGGRLILSALPSHEQDAQSAKWHSSPWCPPSAVRHH